MFRGIGTALLSAAIFAAPALAHHTVDKIDLERTVELSGTVEEFTMMSPASLLLLRVPGENGTVTEWVLDLASPGALSRAGWSATTLESGDAITTTIHPLKDGAPGGKVVIVEFPDGTALDG